jgi:hypothetical protein
MAVGVEAVDFTAGAVEAVEVVAGMAEAVGSMDLRAFMVEAVDFTAEAVGFMDLPPMVAWPTWVMGGVVMH